MFPAISGQVSSAQCGDCERRWAWRGPSMGRTYGCPLAGMFRIRQ